MRIPTRHIGTISFQPLDIYGNPAVLDGPLTFALAPGSEAFAALLPTNVANTVDIRGDAAGVATILASGDVVLDGVTEVGTWPCEVEIYEMTDHLSCELIGIRQVVDE